MTQPNILLIQVDQHRYDCLGATGHPLLQTPHLDRLAAEGTSFRHAFTPIAVCVPARNSLLYGTWPSDHLAIANWGTEAPRPAREGLVPYTQALNEAGYHLSHVGKWHIHPQKGPLAYSYHERVSDKEYAAWRAARGCPAVPSNADWRGGVDPDVRPEDTRLGWGAEQVIAQLERSAARSVPFYLEWDTNEPHLPSLLPEPYHSLYDPDDIPPWPGFSDPLDGKPYAQAQQRRTWQVEGWTWEQWAPIVARYLGTISLLDAQVGRVLVALEQLGLAQNTLVVFTTDHGDMCGSHGMVDKHMVMYDDVIRVPLIVRWPGQVDPGTSCEAFVSHALDLAATFCDAAGAPIPETVRGQSLLPLLSGDKSVAREDILAMYHGNQFGLYSQRMLRDRRHKYVWNATAEDELYDLEVDPGELINRTTDAAYREVLSQMRERMVTWMERINDPLLNGWTRQQLLENLSV